MSQATSAANPRRRKLDRDEIVATVLRMTRKSGLDGLTMRDLAAELGVTTMAAYHWVPSKQALIDLAIESVFAEVTAVQHSGTWVEQLRSSALTYRDVVSRYPGLAGALIEHPLGEQARGGIAHSLGLLREAGFVEPELGQAWATYQAYIFGHLSLQEHRVSRGPSRRRDEVGRLLYDGASPKSFEWGLERVLDGLRLAAAQPDSLRANLPAR